MVWPTSDFSEGRNPERARTTSSPAISDWRRLTRRVGLAFQARARAAFRSRVAGASAPMPGDAIARLQVSHPNRIRRQGLGDFIPRPPLQLFLLGIPGSGPRRARSAEPAGLLSPPFPVLPTTGSILRPAPGPAA